MKVENTSQKRIIKSVEFYKNLEGSLKGLSDIIKLQYEEDEFFYKAAADNLLVLAKYIPELFSSKRSSRIIDLLTNITYSTKYEKNNSELAK
ncbi:MAG: hypothetical protein BAJALOKI1v1_180007 [Promethearchaeota archaeon]|nr:MAG: hypothetical protein BAJALOKI1v1_180007 [Candidatus Lokiarchaeota archaeon]